MDIIYHLLFSGFPGDIGRDGERGFPGLPAPKGDYFKTYKIITELLATLTSQIKNLNLPKNNQIRSHL